MRATCENCGTPVEEQYCSSCGQSTATIDLPVADFAKDFASEAIGLDSRVRRTLWPLIARPGQIPREYVEGHRARFVPPVRLYLLASFFMFVVLSFADFEVSNVEVGGRQVTLDSVASLPLGDEDPSTPPEAEEGEGAFTVDLGTEEMNERLTVGFQRLLADPGAFNEVFIDRMAKSMFVLLPGFAGLLKLLWWNRLYVHHLIFAIYFHSFVFLLVGMVSLPQQLGVPGLAQVADLLLLAVPPYLVIALRTFYGSGWVSTLLKGAVVTTTYGVMGIVTMLALLVLSILAL